MREPFKFDHKADIQDAMPAQHGTRDIRTETVHCQVFATPIHTVYAVRY
jgi:hypothetical protein